MRHCRLIATITMALCLACSFATAQENFWAQLNSPPGVVNTIIFDASGHLYAGTAGNGMYYSGDSAGTWGARNSGLTNLSIQKLAFNSSGTLFAATQGSGIFKSTNGGSAWSAANTGIAYAPTRSVVVTSSGALFAAAATGYIYKSTNGGGSWSTSLTSVNTAFRNMVVGTNGNIYVDSPVGIYRSTNSGGSWSQINTGLVTKDIRALAAAPNGDIYAGSYGDGGFYRSTNNGNSWSSVNAGLEGNDVKAITFTSNGDIYVGTGNALSQGGVYTSTDNGSSWTNMTGDLVTTNVVELVQDAAGNFYAGSTGIFRTTDGGTSWTEVDNGIDAYGPVSALTFGSTGSIFAGTPSGVFRSGDDGATWSYHTSGFIGSARTISLATASSGKIIIGTYDPSNSQKGGLYTSDDDAASFTRKLTVDRIQAIARAPDSTLYASAAWSAPGGFYRSTDNGSTWTKINSTIGLAFSLTFANGNIYAGTESYGMSRSTDGGYTWATLKSIPHSITTIAVTQNGTLLAGTGGEHIYRSTDGGSNWSTVLSQEYNINTSIVAPNTGDIYVGTPHGVYRSTNDGASWAVLNTGLTSKNTTTLVIGHDGHLYAATSAGIFRSSEQVGPIVEEDTTTTSDPTPSLTAPVLKTPVSGIINQPLLISLTWNAVTNATGYQAQVSTDAAFPAASIVADKQSINGTATQVGGLALNTVYYWRVRATAGNTASDWSQVWHFTTAPIPTPLLASPDSGSTGQPLNPTLTWNDVAACTKWRLVVSTTPDFTPGTIVLDDTTITTLSRTVGSLSGNTKYYWRIRGRNSTQKTSWSNAWCFTTEVGGGGNEGGGNDGGGNDGDGGNNGGSVPAVPVLASPATGATGQLTNLTLTWYNVQGATSYDIQVSTDAAFTAGAIVVNDASVAATSRAISQLSGATTYYWHVRSNNAYGHSAWSTAWNFQTASLPSFTGLSVNSSRPRILIDSASKGKWTARLNPADPNYGSWLNLRSQANTLKSYPVIPYNYANRNIWHNTTIQYVYEGYGYHDAAFTLGMAYLVSGDTSYSNKLMELADELIRAEYDTTQGQGILQVDHSYPSRNICPAIAVIYDWCYDQLGTTRKTQMVNVMNRWFDSLRSTYGYSAYQNNGPATGNYFGSHLIAAAYMGYASYGDNPRAQEMIDWARARFDGEISTNLLASDIPVANRAQTFEGSVRSYRGQGYLPPTSNVTGTPFKGGTALQGWGYTGDEWCRMIDYTVIVRSATGEDLVGSHGTWFSDIYRSLRHSLFPNSINLDPWGDWGGNQGAVIYHDLPARLAYVLGGTPDSAGAQHLAYVQIPQNSTYGYYYPNLWIYPLPSWQEFLYKDVTRSAAQTSLPPYYSGFVGAYPQGGPGNGALPKFLMRSDWGIDATWATLDMEATVYDDHQHYRAGHLNLVHGIDQLLIDGSSWRGTAPGLGVIGSATGYGMTQSALTNTLFIDDYGDYNVSSPNYVGGQGAWGRNDVVAAQQDDNLSYVRSDLTTAYDIRAYPNQWSDTVRRPLNYFYRNFLYLRGSNIFVVYDQVNMKNSVNPSGQYRKEIRWHFPVQPTVVGSDVTVQHGSSKLYLHTLLPPSPTITKVDVSNNPDNKLGAAYNYMFNMPVWRVDVTDQANPLTMPFLTVLQPGGTSLQEMTTTQISTLDGAMIGARITTAGMTDYVLFNNGAGQTPTPIASTSYTIAGGNASRHTLCGLTPGASYQVTVNGSTVSVAQNLAGSYVASASGVLQFMLVTGGAKITTPVTGDAADLSFSLEAYPNPVSRTAQFRFRLPVDCQSVRLEIFDIFGNRVALPLDKGMSAGEYTVEFDLSSVAELPNGNYFCRIEADGQMLTRTFTIVR